VKFWPTVTGPGHMIHTVEGVLDRMVVDPVVGHIQVDYREPVRTEAG